MSNQEEAPVSVVLPTRPQHEQHEQHDRLASTSSVFGGTIALNRGQGKEGRGVRGGGRYRAEAKGGGVGRVSSTIKCTDDYQMY
jgi:hypothetical protein